MRVITKSLLLILLCIGVLQKISFAKTTLSPFPDVIYTISEKARFSPQGSFIAEFGETLKNNVLFKQVKTDTAHIVGSLQIPTNASVSSVLWAPDEQSIVVTSKNNGIYLFSLQTQENSTLKTTLLWTIQTPNSSSTAYPSAFFNKGTMLAGFDSSKTIFVWDIRQKKIVAQQQTSHALGIIDLKVSESDANHPSILFTLGKDMFVQSWKIDGSKIETAGQGLIGKASPRSITISPKSNYLVAFYDDALACWNFSVNSWIRVDAKQTEQNLKNSSSFWLSETEMLITLPNLADGGGLTYKMKLVKFNGTYTVQVENLTQVIPGRVLDVVYKEEARKLLFYTTQGTILSYNAN